jgi:EmrB/QacA subfamily drug resistance transporter
VTSASPSPHPHTPIAVANRPVDPRAWWVLLAVGVGTFMSALDGSVVNTVLPLLRTELHTSVATIEWVTTVYLLVVSGLLLGVGRAGDLRGHKRIYLGGFVIFVIGSALCGLAPSAEWLIALRALQAVGASMLFANSPAILTRAFPPTHRGRALGMQAMMTYLGLTTGPSLGGWLATAFSWRAVFYINVPVGAIAIALALRVIEDDRPEKVAEPFDWTGAALFTAGLVALLVALNQGHAWGWTAAPTVVLLAASVLVLVAFTMQERRRPSPMLDLTLFRSRLFSASTVSAVLNYVCVYSVLFVLPFLLVQGRGLTTQHAGLVMTAQPLVMAVVAPVSGALSDRVGSRAIATLGMLVLAAGLLLVALVAAAGTLKAIALSLGVVGLGVGLFASPNNSALMGAAPAHRQGIASGVLATARNVGMALGVGLAGAVFTTVLAHHGGGNPAIVAGVQASLFVGCGIAVAGAVASFLR